MSLFKTIKKCRICKGKIKHLYKYKSTPLGEDFVKKTDKRKQQLIPLNLFICKKCYLVQIAEIVNPNLIYENYLYETKTSITLDEHFKSYASKVIKNLNLKKNDLIVDIGSNDGSLLKYFKKNNCNVVGIEPAKHIAIEATRNGILTINSFFNKDCVKNLKKKFGKAKVVTANNVFANIENLNEWIKLIKLILKDDGYFILESFYLGDLIKNKVFDFIYHEHHSAFSLKPINFLCDKHDLKLIHVEQSVSKGGSLRYYICNKNFNGFLNLYSINKFKLREKNEKIYYKSTYDKFFDKIEKENKNLHDFLKKNNELNIFGFGASITCITLIYQFSLQKKIKILFDDNQIKQKLLSPRDRIPIKSLMNNKNQKNSILLILAWRYSDLIIKRHKKILKNFKYVIQLMPKFKKIKI